MPVLGGGGGSYERGTPVPLADIPVFDGRRAIKEAHTPVDLVFGTERQGDETGSYFRLIDFCITQL